jgi:hypothetical protein
MHSSNDKTPISTLRNTANWKLQKISFAMTCSFGKHETILVVAGKLATDMLR